MDPATLALIIPAIASVGGKVGEGLLAPRPQHFTSFEGGPNDPNKLLSAAGTNLSDVFSSILPKMLATPDLSDAYVQDLPSRRPPDNLPIDLSGPHATWGGGSDGPKRLAPSLPSSASPMIPTGRAPAPDVQQPTTDFAAQLMAALDPASATSSGPTRVPLPGHAPPAGTISSRTKGAAQLLMHLSSPSMMAGATA